MSIVGLNECQVTKIVQATTSDQAPVFVGNVNAPRQIVIAGSNVQKTLFADVWAERHWPESRFSQADFRPNDLWFSLLFAVLAWPSWFVNLIILYLPEPQAYPSRLKDDMLGAGNCLPKTE